MIIIETPKHKHVVLPTQEAVNVYLRAIRARKVKWNYANCFRDTNGFGLQLAIADWCTKENQTYISK